MKTKSQNNPHPLAASPLREYDFALVLTGLSELTEDVETALFEAGCDDATVSLGYSRIWLEFSRRASSLQEAILSAIRAVRGAGLGADVLQVDECNLVTQSEIARRIHRSRQMVHQYITGQRGPGGFPPPVCHIRDATPLWQWCDVSYWLSQNDMIRPELQYEAEVVAAINNALEASQQRVRHPQLVDEIQAAIARPQKKPSR